MKRGNNNRILLAIYKKVNKKIYYFTDMKEYKVEGVFIRTITRPAHIRVDDHKVRFMSRCSESFELSFDTRYKVYHDFLGEANNGEDNEES